MVGEAHRCLQEVGGGGGCNKKGGGGADEKQQQVVALYWAPVPLEFFDTAICADISHSHVHVPQRPCRHLPQQTLAPCVASPFVTMTTTFVNATQLSVTYGQLARQALRGGSGLGLGTFLEL